jgi:hypothetical protein
MWAKDVVVPGAGPVVKNTAALITIPPQDNACRRQKTIIILFVVAKRLGSRRRTIVEADIQGIVRGDGKSKSVHMVEWVAIINQKPISEEALLASNAEDLSRV